MKFIKFEKTGGVTFTIRLDKIVSVRDSGSIVTLYLEDDSHYDFPHEEAKKMRDFVEKTFKPRLLDAKTSSNYG
ncbi:MAG: hypothetical protein RLZZ15_1198 [Verrucomicrobiota bacterium]|jgi:hypothetical protein